MEQKPALRLIHSEAVLRSRRYRGAFEYWSKQTTERIVESLRPGAADALKVKPDGRVFDDNTRLRVLLERDYNVNELPREPV